MGHSAAPWAQSFRPHRCVLALGSPSRHHLHDMDLYPCRSFCIGRQEHRGYRRHCGSDAKGLPWRVDHAWPVCVGLHHLAIDRHFGGHRSGHHSPGGGDSACGGRRVDRSHVCCRSDRRCVFRRQSELHIRHHNCLDPHSGMLDERQVQGQHLDRGACCNNHPLRICGDRP